MAADRTPSLGWTLFAGAAVLLFGLFLLVKGWRDLPLAREALTVADHVGPIDAETPLVSEGRGRNRGHYRTQLIPLAPAGQPAQTYAPARALWVSDLDSIRYGQGLRFLVDPATLLIYEATTQGRTLLSYDETADNLQSAARYRMLTGAALLAGAAWQVGAGVRRHRRNAARSSPPRL